MKTGLVLEGGGMRGLFTAGVMDVMMADGLHFDGIVGVSAGAAFGCNYKSHQPGRALRYNMRFRHDPKYMGLRSLILTGDLVGAEYAYHTLPTQLDVFDFDTYRQDPTEFHVVCTDACSGETVYHVIPEFDFWALEWIRASASMPIVSRTVKIDGRELLDGGITNSIPLRYFQQQGYERNIVILTQPQGFRKQRTRLMPLFHTLLRRYPAIIEAMGRRHLMYNEQLDYIRQQELLGNTLLIYPEQPLPISRTSSNASKMQHVYDLGRRMGEQNLERMRSFLAGPD